MITVSDKICRENQNSHFMFRKIFFFRKSAIYEIMWKNLVLPDMPQMTKWRMRIACWLTKATDIYINYVILIAFQGNNGFTTVTYVRLYLSLLFIKPCSSRLLKFFSINKTISR